MIAGPFVYVECNININFTIVVCNTKIDVDGFFVKNYLNCAQAVQSIILSFFNPLN